MTSTIKRLLAIAALLVILAGGWYVWHEYRKARISDCCRQDPFLTSGRYENNGVAFSYPSSYDLQERDLTINDEVTHIVTLLPKGRTIPVNGEGGTAMTLSIFTPSKPQPLADWLRAMSSGSPAPTGGFDYQEGTVGGEPALIYSATGLYESDNIAVMKDTHAYIFSSTWLTRDDRILKDFSSLISSVSFK